MMVRCHHLNGSINGLCQPFIQDSGEQLSNDGIPQLSGIMVRCHHLNGNVNSLCQPFMQDGVE
jgi:hypothetical protein